MPRAKFQPVLTKIEKRPEIRHRQLMPPALQLLFIGINHHWLLSIIDFIGKSCWTLFTHVDTGHLCQRNKIQVICRFKSVILHRLLAEVSTHVAMAACWIMYLQVNHIKIMKFSIWQLNDIRLDCVTHNVAVNEFRKVDESVSMLVEKNAEAHLQVSMLLAEWMLL